MKKTILLLVLIFLSAGILLASGNSGAAAEDGKPRFVYIVKDMTNPYYWRMREGAQRAAADYDVDMTWLAAQFNGDIEGQIGIVESQLALRPDALILVPMNATALIPKVREANQMDIPVFIPDTRLQEGAAEYVSFIGLDERASAIQMAEFLVDYYDGQANLVILEGYRGSSTAEERLVGFNEVFDKHPGMVVLASQTAEWDREKGLKVTEDLLQAHPNMDLVVASNDEMALGAVQAIKTAGKLDQIKVTGDDAIPAVLAALRDGEILATIDGNTDQVGYKSVEAAYKYVVDGEELPAWIKVPSSVMLKDDVTDDYLKSRGITLD
jgi:ribose transport system substrate-binding protein